MSPKKWQRGECLSHVGRAISYWRSPEGKLNRSASLDLVVLKGKSVLSEHADRLVRDTHFIS